MLEKLKEPFPKSDIEWRVQRAMKTKNGDKAIVVPYVQNRAIMNRLDALFGIDGWKNEYKEIHNGVLCGISLKINDEWITKWDGADLTNIEATKGGLSNSMKRAAVQFGLGRYLYQLDEYWADIKQKGQNYIKDDKKGITGYWDDPKLPDWALPSEERNNDKKQTTPQQEKVKPPDKNLSEAQVKRLFAIGKEKDFTNAQITKAVMDRYKKTQISHLTKAEYDELVNSLKNSKPKTNELPFFTDDDIPRNGPVDPDDPSLPL